MLANPNTHLGAETWALLPYYSPTDCTPQSLAQLAETSAITEQLFDHTVVVTDGLPVSKAALPNGIDQVNLPAHLGKAAALRAGILHIVTKSENNSDLIVQIDTDFDQDPADAIRFLHRYTELGQNKHEPTLLIGDRYHHMPENLIRYRLGLMAINAAVTREQGYRSITDFQSGFRAYSVDLAETFVSRGSSYSYGIEAEQTVLALAQAARIESVYLTRSRLRTASTDAQKWIQNLNGMLDHAADFGNNSGIHGNFARIWKGLERVCDAMSERKDAEVIIPVAGTDRRFLFYMPDEESYTLVHS